MYLILTKLFCLKIYLIDNVAERLYGTDVGRTRLLFHKQVLPDAPCDFLGMGQANILLFRVIFCTDDFRRHQSKLNGDKSMTWGRGCFPFFYHLNSI